MLPRFIHWLEVLASLLSFPKNIPELLKGDLSGGFCGVQVNSVLKSLLWTLTQKAPAEL